MKENQELKERRKKVMSIEEKFEGKEKMMKGKKNGKILEEKYDPIFLGSHKKAKYAYHFIYSS